MLSFHEWLQTRCQEPCQADRLATLIAPAGAAGVSLDGLRRLLGISPEVLEDLLRAMVAAGQVVMVRVGGRIVYRAAG